jgi:hypothetical protein
VAKRVAPAVPRSAKATPGPSLASQGATSRAHSAGLARAASSRHQCLNDPEVPRMGVDLAAIRTARSSLLPPSERYAQIAPKRAAPLNDGTPAYRRGSVTMELGGLEPPTSWVRCRRAAPQKRRICSAS